jgi:hypothetical protein
MSRARVESDPIAVRLDAILTVLQNLLIVEGVKLGMTRDELRPIVGVQNNRVSAVMRQLKKAKNRGD